MEAIAVSLQYDCLHPAFECYENIASDARFVVERFRAHRASFIINSTAREDARRLLEDVASKVRNLLVRYQFIEELAKKWQGRPQIGKIFEEEDADQKWIHGVVSTDTGDTDQVLLTDGTLAFQVKFEIKTRKILPYTRHFLQFMCRALQSVTPDTETPRRDPSTSTLIRSYPTSCYIVGWTLSCRTKLRGRKTFSVTSGGILENNLSIAVKGPIFRQATWRCRIYFVNRQDYEFPRLSGGIKPIPIGN